MRSNFLRYTWKGNSGYSYGYVLITHKYSIDDIKGCNKKIVMWGWRPDTAFTKYILEESGISPDYVCDVIEPFNSGGVGYGTPIMDYRELLKNHDEYYFIIALKNYYDINIAIKLIQYAGCDEFGIVFGDYTKDFDGNVSLQDAFFESINEVFEPFDFLYNKVNLENIRLASLPGAGYWDVPYGIIYNQYRKNINKRKVPKYLEIGPGIGIMSLSLKKLMDIDITWLTIPNEEARWSELKKNTTACILKKYNINIVTGFIETDPFYGKYDIIVLAQVMEHFVFNPVNTFKKLASLLSDNGYIFCSVPEESIHYNVQNYREIPYPEQLSSQEREREDI